MMNKYEPYKKGRMLYRQRRYERAIAYFDHALAQDPNYMAALNSKGFSLYRLGRYKEALACFDRALEIDPNSKNARENREMVMEEWEKVKGSK